MSNAKKGNSKVYDRLCFLIAYDYYSKADAQDRMEMAREQFPSREELFTEGLEAGDTMQLNCWTVHNTILRERPLP